MDAHAYVRVSSKARDHATQRSAIERTAAARGDTITAWFAEKRSATTMAREELQRLLADARAGRLRGQRLSIFRLDRLTRTGIADTLTTLEDLRAHGVDVVSVADGQRRRPVTLTPSPAGAALVRWGSRSRRIEPSRCSPDWPRSPWAWRRGALAQSRTASTATPG
jgi:DNA invertase Pin-like site-specific DNA recombinase